MEVRGTFDNLFDSQFCCLNARRCGHMCTTVFFKRSKGVHIIFKYIEYLRNSFSAVLVELKKYFALLAFRLPVASLLRSDKQHVALSVKVSRLEGCITSCNML